MWRRLAPASQDWKRCAPAPDGFNNPLALVQRFGSVEAVVVTTGGRGNTKEELGVALTLLK